MPESIYRRAFDAGVDFRTFLEQAEEHRVLWHSVTERLHLEPEHVERARACTAPLRLVALADDWCGDAINTLPVVAAVSEAAPGAQLRIVPRDEWPELMDLHLTNGARSIPMVAVTDPTGRCVGAWGPRPTELQEWFEQTGRDLEFDERYRELRRWYARDRGATTALEMIELLEQAGGTGRS